MKKFIYNDDVGFVDLVQHMGDDLTIVNSARVSFGVQKDEMDDKDRKLISYLAKHRHTSTFEHNVATFRVKVPLFIRSQHHRHRTWSYNEISRRYTHVDLEFYYPSELRAQHKSNRQASSDNFINPEISLGGYGAPGPATEIIRSHCEDSVELFYELIREGVAKEQARMILPQNLYTTYYATANLSNIIKFIDLRMHEGAQWEIQQLAKGMLEIIEEIWPVSAKSYRDNINQ